MAVVITNIGSLVTNDQSLGPGLLGEIDNAAVVIEDGKVPGWGVHQMLQPLTNR